MGLDGTGAPSASVPPVTHLIWATYDGPMSSTVTSLMNAYDNLGGGNPTVLLVKVGAQVFGGYAADPWTFDDQYGGTPRSFLFTITRDCKIPYTGRQRGPRQPSDELLRLEHDRLHAEEVAYYEEQEGRMAQLTGGQPLYDEGGRLIVIDFDAYGREYRTLLPKPHPRPFVRCDALKANPETVQFGVTDLVLRGDLSGCSSMLEYSYGIGLRPGSEEARTFLAGVASFKPDAVELWAVSPDTGMGGGGGLGDSASVGGASASGGAGGGGGGLGASGFYGGGDGAGRE